MQGIVELPLAVIRQGRNPNVEFDPVTMRTLIASIRAHGVLQPIRVRDSGDGVYTIIAGYRRYEAARRAGRRTIPAVVASPEDAEALIETLTAMPPEPLDVARAYEALLAETGWTQTELAKRLHTSQPTISNMLRLLDSLHPAVQEALHNKAVSVSHAKALASLSEEDQYALLAQVIEEHLPSRAVEAMVSERKRSWTLDTL